MAEQQAQASGAATTEGSLLDDILSETQLKPTDDGYDVTRKGIQAFITEGASGELNAMFSPRVEN